GHRSVRDPRADIDLFGQALGETAKLPAATGETDAARHDVSDQCRRGIVQRVFYRVDDAVHRSRNRLADFDGTDFDTGRQSGDEVAPADVTHALLRTGLSRADFNFDFFRLSFTDEQVVFGAHVLHHVLVH